MIKTLTIYETSDGTRYDDMEKAIAHDRLAANVKAVMDHLYPRPASIDFANGDGYVQHDPDTLRQVRVQLYELVKPHLAYIIDTWKTRGETDESLAMCHPSWFGRFLDGSPSSRPLEEAYRRLWCIDEQGREWGQPYFANNPHMAKQVCING